MTPLLTRIREKVIEANPEKATRNISVLIPEPFGGIINFRDTTIRLADVLLAIEQNQPQQVSMNAATTLGTNWGEKEKWNLRSDDLENQSPECWEFIGEILGV